MSILAKTDSFWAKKICFVGTNEEILQQSKVTNNHIYLCKFQKTLLDNFFHVFGHLLGKMLIKLLVKQEVLAK